MQHSLKYRNYEIYYERDCTPLKLDWTYVHDGYDGAPDANDNRCGRCKTILECVNEIDALEEY